jgi:hypothetical protein
MILKINLHSITGNRKPIFMVQAQTLFWGIFLFGLGFLNLHAQSEEGPIPLENARLYLAREPDTSGILMVGGYLDTYWAYYGDTANTNGYHTFPTISPRSKQLGLNMIQAQLKYRSGFARANLAIHGGDIPRAAWSGDFNFIQEANVGFKFAPKIWLDAGFFKTHIGYESILPRDNFTISLATTTFYEPYFLSGAKVTWMAGKNWSLQANLFNEFNGFVDVNGSPAGGMSLYWEPTKDWVLGLNQITSNEKTKEAGLPKLRAYQNLVTYRKFTKTEWVGEVNFGFQSNTGLTDSLGTAKMFSALLAGKYKFTRRYAVSGRYEFFYDPEEILTGAVYNASHQLVGLVISGFTLCGEFKPTEKSFFRVEARELITTHSDEDIFYNNQQSSRNRLECHLAMGVWF